MGLKGCEQRQAEVSGRRVCYGSMCGQWKVAQDSVGLSWILHNYIETSGPSRTPLSYKKWTNWTFLHSFFFVPSLKVRGCIPQRWRRLSGRLLDPGAKRSAGDDGHRVTWLHSTLLGRPHRQDGLLRQAQHRLHRGRQPATWGHRTPDSPRIWRHHDYQGDATRPGLAGRKIVRPRLAGRKIVRAWLVGRKIVIGWLLGRKPVIGWLVGR